ncbi:PSP1-domain-containing protein [Lojkania enalia]|uniref:PSP1-domain-containing protein n=1 Tax=Lojkania enalia TaxID=147567 RepID=A0A9P4K4Z7_9PLEO|nr:PSP1-domain-containing protein [Didymosphaeria enalia]
MASRLTTGPASKLLRRPTPDSEVLASSDEDRPSKPPAPRRPSSGWLQDIQPNRKFSLPSGSLTPELTTSRSGAFPFNTASFSSNHSNPRLKDAAPSPTSVYPPGDKPFPSPTTDDDGIGFLLNQSSAVRKSTRSQSYSIGQADLESSPIGQFASNRMRNSLNVRNRPSKPSLLGESLTLLREDEMEDHTSSTSPPPSQPLPPPADPLEGTHDDLWETDQELFYSRAHPTITRRFSENIVYNRPVITYYKHQNPPSSIVMQTERRHSLAVPHSLHSHPLPQSNLATFDEDDETPQHTASSGEMDSYDAAAYFSGQGPASRAINASAISAAHPDPIIPRGPSFSFGTTQNTNGSSNTLTMQSAYGGRPGRRLYVVSFKCSRADIYYVFDNTGLEIRRGDLVIVEGDRGCDLGQVTYADVSLEDAKKHKAEANEEHFRWLVMFSQYSLAGNSNDSPMLGALARANGFPNANRSALAGMGAQQETDAKPKMIKRLAQQHEIMGLRDKEGQEAKAKRVGAVKAAEHKLPMEILDAEYQADFHKLTYYYYAEAYVNFNDLVTDLFKNYKVRIWMSAVNPASVVNPAGLMQVPPPSAIGPGAIIPSNSNPTSFAVGPGFGASAFRSHEQYGRSNTAVTHPQGQYDESYYPFAHQMPGYPGQPPYTMQQWAQGQHGQDMYGRYPGYPAAATYPNATASGSPMNYGGYYPPGTYSSSPSFNTPSSAAPYRGGHTSGAGGQSGYITSGGYGTSPAYNGGYTATSSAGYGGSSSYTGHAATSSAGYRTSFTATSSAEYDPTQLGSYMQNMSFGN